MYHHGSLAGSAGLRLQSAAASAVSVLHCCTHLHLFHIVNPPWAALVAQSLLTEALLSFFLLTILIQYLEEVQTQRAGKLLFLLFFFFWWDGERGE